MNVTVRYSLQESSISTIDEFLKNVKNLQVDMPTGFQCPFCSQKTSIHGGCCSGYTEAVNNLLASYKLEKEVHFGRDAIAERPIQLEEKNLTYEKADVLPLDVFRPENLFGGLLEVKGIYQDNLLHFYILLPNDSVYKCSVACPQIAEEIKNRKVIKIYQLTRKTVVHHTSSPTLGNYHWETKENVVDRLSYSEFIQKLMP